MAVAVLLPTSVRSADLVLSPEELLRRTDVGALAPESFRSRMRLISSQVSTLAPEWTGRWSKARRLQVAWWMLEQVQPAHLITHRFPLTQAAQAYAMLDQHPEEALQVLLTYEG